MGGLLFSFMQIGMNFIKTRESRLRLILAQMPRLISPRTTTEAVSERIARITVWLLMSN